MITESKVIELFCMSDDFCKFYNVIMAKYTLKLATKRKHYRDFRLGHGEIMLIMILFHDSGYCCLKHFYQEKICIYMRHLFPKVVSYNRFVKLEKEVLSFGSTQVSASLTVPLTCMQESENRYPQDIQRNSTKRQMFHGLVLRI